LATDEGVVLGEHGSPPLIAERRRLRRCSSDVGKEHRHEHALGFFVRRRDSGEIGQEASDLVRQRIDVSRPREMVLVLLVGIDGCRNLVGDVAADLCRHDPVVFALQH
jgi:hypothetical protein